MEKINKENFPEEVLRAPLIMRVNEDCSFNIGALTKENEHYLNEGWRKTKYDTTFEMGINVLNEWGIPEGAYCYKFLKQENGDAITDPCPYYNNEHCDYLDCEIDDQVKNCEINK